LHCNICLWRKSCTKHKSENTTVRIHMHFVTCVVHTNTMWTVCEFCSIFEHVCHIVGAGPLPCKHKYTACDKHTDTLGMLQITIFPHLFHTIRVTRTHPAIARAYFKHFCSSGFQNMHPDAKLTAKDATGAKALANSTSPRPESNQRRPRPGFGRTSGGKSVNLILLTGSILGHKNSDFPVPPWYFNSCIHMFIGAWIRSAPPCG